MANPELVRGFDLNDTNTTPIVESKITDGFLVQETVPSALHNEMFKQLFAAVNHNRNGGAWEWEDPTVNDTEYNTGYVVRYLGNIFMSKVDANTVTPVDGASWLKINNFVDLINAQTIAGVKTFSSFPITPSAAPTANYQVANKKYVDDSTSDLVPQTDVADATPNSLMRVGAFGLGGLFDSLLVLDDLDDATIPNGFYSTDSGTLNNPDSRSVTSILMFTDTTRRFQFQLTIDGDFRWRIYDGTWGAWSGLIGAGAGGQIWASVVGSRVAGVTYTNTSSKPISLAVTVGAAGSASTYAWNVQVAGLTVIDNEVEASAVSRKDSITVIVPPGATYVVNLVTNAQIIRWFELS